MWKLINLKLFNKIYFYFKKNFFKNKKIIYSIEKQRGDIRIEGILNGELAIQIKMGQKVQKIDIIMILEMEME